MMTVYWLFSDQLGLCVHRECLMVLETGMLQWVREGRSGGSGRCGLRDAWTGGLGQLQLVFCCSVSNYTVLIESSLRDWKEQRKLRRSEGKLTVHLASMVCGWAGGFCLSWGLEHRQRERERPGGNGLWDPQVGWTGDGRLQLAFCCRSRDEPEGLGPLGYGGSRDGFQSCPLVFWQAWPIFELLCQKFFKNASIIKGKLSGRSPYSCVTESQPARWPPRFYFFHLYASRQWVCSLEFCNWPQCEIF